MSVLSKVSRWWVNKQVTDQPRFQTGVSFHSVKEVLILDQIASQEQYIELENALRSLPQNFNKTVVLFWTGKKMPEFKMGNSYHIITRNDLNWFGIPKKEIIGKFMNNRFDVLFDFSSRCTDAIYYVLSIIFAKSKVCVSNMDKEQIGDLLIEYTPGQTKRQVGENMIKYLKVLNK